MSTDQELQDFFGAQADKDKVVFEVDRNKTKLDYEGSITGLRTIVEMIPAMQAGMPVDKVGMEQIDLQKLKSNNQLKMGVSLAVLGFAVIVAFLVIGARK